MHSVQVKARTLSGAAWSALNQATYALEPVAESLHIAQVMYPTQTDAADGFVELTNTGSETVNLNLVKLSAGIDFVFPSIELAPEEHIFVVQDRAAFAALYGPDLRIAGQFSGTLNPGERIRLEDALGRSIHAFPDRDN